MSVGPHTIDSPQAAGHPRPDPGSTAAPQLPTVGGDTAASTVRRALTGRHRHALEQRAAARGHGLDALLLCAFGDVLTAWSQTDTVAVTLRQTDRHLPHRTGLPAGSTLMTITAVTDPGAPFTDRAAATEALLRGTASRRMPAHEPVTAGGCVLTIQPAHVASRPLRRAAPVDCILTVRSGELCTDWHTTGAPSGLVDDLADAYAELLHDLAINTNAWHATYREHLPARQRRTRDRVNTTAGPLPDALLHEMFHRQAARTPHAPAVISDQRTISYRQLRAAANAIGARLHERHVTSGQLVAVVLDKGWEQVAAVLGILTAGAAYVPIAPDLPAQRLHHLLGHAEADIALTTPQLADTLPWPDTVTAIPVTDDLLTAATTDPPPANTRPTDLAYVIYTSGSTGEPKGVMISHQAAGNTITDINRRHHISSGDRVLALASLSFDLSVYDIFGPLAVGGAVVMPVPGTSRAPWYWLEAINTHQVTVWNSVPALMHMLTVYATAREEPLPASLRLILMSGDWIPVTLPEAIRALAPGDIDIISMGGATEAAIWSNDYRITIVDPAWPSIPYGTPLTNQFFEVLDPHLRRCPDWVPGELYIGGTGLADGYWRDPDRTAASFIHHRRTGARLYRTGDLGRYLPDGNLEFLGRNDHQVKIQGFRVELGEIEAALLTHPHVTGAVVTAIGPASGERRLAGYIVAANATDTDHFTAQLREHLHRRLPAYMVPATLTILDRLPLTANGKVDRNALPAPEP